MSKRRKLVPQSPTEPLAPGYEQVLGAVAELLESARRAAARSVNALITATYWEIGRRIVEFEQGGKDHAEYGTVLLKRLAVDLTDRFGRGFSWRNLYQMRGFYLAYREILQTVSAKSAEAPRGSQFDDKQQKASVDSTILPTGTEESEITLTALARRFPLPWSHYVLLLKVDKPEAREFYEAEARRNGWTVRQLERQITTLFYDRTLASRNKGRCSRREPPPKLASSCRRQRR